MVKAAVMLQRANFIPVLNVTRAHVVLAVR